MSHFPQNQSIIKWLILAAALMLAFTPSLPAGTLFSLLRMGGENLLVEIDTGTFQITEIGSIQASYSSGGLAWDPESETLYMVNADQYLWSIDTGTGRADIIGEHHHQLTNPGFISLAYDCQNRNLWATEYRGGFYSINPLDASSERVSTSSWGEHFPAGGMFGLAYNYRQNALLSYQGSNGILYRLNWRDGGGKVILADFEEAVEYNGLTWDPDLNVYWAVNSNGRLVSFDPAADYEMTIHGTGLGNLNGLAYKHSNACQQRPFQINFGLTDAWFDENLPGQGFFFNVFPQEKTMFVSWFTYDLDRPPDDQKALLGESGHRWLTAQGSYADDTADLPVYLTRGGLFDSKQAVAETEEYGNMQINFQNCEAAVLNFSIPSLDIQDSVQLVRVSDDRVSFCEEMEFRTQAD
jgi:hypothetical protein